MIPSHCVCVCVCECDYVHFCKQDWHHNKHRFFNLILAHVQSPEKPEETCYI